MSENDFFFCPFRFVRIPIRDSFGIIIIIIISFHIWNRCVICTYAYNVYRRVHESFRVPELISYRRQTRGIETGYN